MLAFLLVWIHPPGYGCVSCDELQLLAQKLRFLRDGLGAFAIALACGRFVSLLDLLAAIIPSRKENEQPAMKARHEPISYLRMGVLRLADSAVATGAVAIVVAVVLYTASGHLSNKKDYETIKWMVNIAIATGLMGSAASAMVTVRCRAIASSANEKHSELA